MQKLIAGIHRFQKQYWSANRDLFERLAEHGQSPEALFITCCDSRVDPTVIVHGRPGDLFIVKNMGNFVPPYSENPLDGTGVAAAVEYAVEHLHVRDIIVCGHSDCGAMKALYKDRSHYADTPHIGEWLRNGGRTMRVVTASYPELTREERLEITSEENVLVQMENLRTYPVVMKAAQEGRLHVHAWFFDIRTGRVYAYSPEKEQYEPIVFAEE
ncbi:MAG: carbonic anhydrase [Deltaproteobacteria bacterium]|nr:carbonic anhydrase [Deltaproteobacteria bacterium]